MNVPENCNLSGALVLTTSRAAHFFFMFMSLIKYGCVHPVFYLAIMLPLFKESLLKRKSLPNFGPSKSVPFKGQTYEKLQCMYR